MMKRTVLAIAVAGACAWPMATLAWNDGQHVRTPMTDREVGPQHRHMGFMRHDNRYIDDDTAFSEGRDEVQTPLSVSETGPAVDWNSYHGWSHPAPDRFRYSYYSYNTHRPVAGATRGDADTYYYTR
jgi:hypothetical protein